MAQTPPQLQAGGTIRPARFISLSTAANNEALESNSGDATIIGISHDGGPDAPIPSVTSNQWTDGDQLRFYTMGDICRLELGTGGCTAGDFLKPDNDGKGVTSSTDGNIYGARALETASASEFAQVQIIIGFRGA